MNKTIKLSNFYFFTGLFLCLFSLLNETKQVVNIGDTYYVITGNNLAILTFLLFLVIAVLMMVIERYLSIKIKVLQYILFTFPIGYFMFFAGNTDEKPDNFLVNPIAYQWKVEIIPIALMSCFLGSLVLFLFMFGYAFRKWRNTGR